jgi:hypothetical protein
MKGGMVGIVGSKAARAATATNVMAPATTKEGRLKSFAIRGSRRSIPTLTHRERGGVCGTAIQNVVYLSP